MVSVGAGRWSQALSNLEGVMAMMSTASKKDLLSRRGIGPKMTERILEVRAAGKEKGRPLRISDVIAIRGLGKTMLTGDPNAGDVAKYIAFYEDLFSKANKNMYYPETVLSIDLGPVNSAYALVNNQYQVLEWNMLDLGLPTPYTARECYEKVKKSLEALTPADAYVIEEQHQQRTHNMGFLAISINLRCLEAMAYAVLHQVTGVPIRSLPPKRVAGYFDTTSSTSRGKKLKAIAEVKKLIEKKKQTPLGNQVFVREDVANDFNTRKKKDDLSDCLLQALALLDWGHMCRRLESHLQVLSTGDT